MEELGMKKVLLSVVMVLMLSAFTGCNSKTTKFVVDKIETNTIYIKEDNTVDAATVEEFKEEHYQLEELKDFVQSQVAEYNEKRKIESIRLSELMLKDSNAILVLNYNSPKDYSQFNEKEVKLLDSSKLEEYQDKLPSAYINAKDGAYINSDEIFSKGDYKILIVDEATDVIIDGKILYYEHGTILKDNHIQTQGDGTSYIIYKSK